MSEVRVPCLGTTAPLAQVVRAADRALDAISELSEEWEASIRRLKFEQHNRDWLNLVALEEQSRQQQQQAEGGGGGSGCGGLGLPAVPSGAMEGVEAGAEACGAGGQMVAGLDLYDASQAM